MFLRQMLSKLCRPRFIYLWRAHQHSPASQLVCHPVLAVCVYVNSLSQRMWEERAAKSSKVEKRLSIVPLCHLYSFPIYVLGSCRTVLCAVPVSKGSQKKKGTRNGWPDNSRRASLHSVMLKTRSIIKRRPWKPSHSIAKAVLLLHIFSF